MVNTNLDGMRYQDHKSMATISIVLPLFETKMKLIIQWDPTSWVELMKKSFESSTHHLDLSKTWMLFLILTLDTQMSLQMIKLLQNYEKSRKQAKLQNMHSD